MPAQTSATFRAVFTPSILTILGVILYLRLPVVVGQAGLWQALAVLVVAHVIALTTAASVASMATDRNVRGEGAYERFSRSLGLPLGATLGIVLFIGLSLAISLSSIGFAESFLTYWGWSGGRATLRIVGTVVLVALAAVALLRPSFPLRAQLVVLGLIGLSLLSVLFGRYDLAAVAPPPTQAGALPFVVLLGIVFPAVIGVQAGLSLSEEARDRRGLLTGSVAAVLAGFLVYVALGVFLGFRVNADVLAADPRVLFDGALFAPLVAAGAWAASLSAALIFMLAAPRILRATSIHRISPALVPPDGKGGVSHRTLFAALLIAELGILIGDLDAIARTLSLLLITTYGFVNLASAAAIWMRPEVRPQVRIPPLVGLLGALVCVVVMIRLDALALLGVSLAVVSLYALLARRQLLLETGDAWEGFWSAVARTALLRLDRSVMHERSWRPNILQFSAAAEDARLLELGRQIAGKRGMISRFELITPEVGSQNGHGSDLPAEPYGVFARQVECDDVFQGIQSIARYHGFGGVEPNTVLLDWSHDAESADFGRLLQSLTQLDYNVLMLSAGPRDFGEHGRVDIWWRGAGRGTALALAVARYLSIADDWRDASFRVLAVNDEGAAHADGLERQLQAELAEARVAAEVRVVANGVLQRPFEEILAAESSDADLVLLPLSETDVDPAGNGALARAGALADVSGPTLLLHASSFFDDAYARQLPETEAVMTRPSVADLPLLHIVEADPRLDEIARQFDEALQETAETFLRGTVVPAFEANARWARSMGALALAQLDEAAEVADDDPVHARHALRQLTAQFLQHARRLLDASRTRDLETRVALLEDGADWLLDQVERLASICPHTLSLELDRDAFVAEAPNEIGSRIYRSSKHAAARLLRRASVEHSVAMRSIARRRLSDRIPHVLIDATRAVAADAHRTAADMRRLIGLVLDALARAETELEAGAAALRAVLDEERPGIESASADALSTREWALESAALDARVSLRELASHVAADVDRLDAPYGGVRWRSIRRVERTADVALDTPARWAEMHSLVLNGLEAELLLRDTLGKVTEITGKARADLRQRIRSGAMASLRDVDGALAEFLDGKDTHPQAAFGTTLEDWPAFHADEIAQALLEELRAATADLPERVTLASPAALQVLAQGNVPDDGAVTLSLRNYVDVQVEAVLVAPVQQALLRIETASLDAEEAAQEATRQAAFRTHDGAAASDASAGRDEDLRAAMRRLADEHARLAGLADALDTTLSERSRLLTDSLHPDTVARAAGRAASAVPRRWSPRAVARVRDFVDATSALLTDHGARMLYQRSQAQVGARATHDAGGWTPDHIIEAVTAARPDADVVDDLPLHYRQLFLGKPRISRDAWVGWTEEKRLAAAAVDYFRRGLGGGLLITGPPLSGKSSLAQFIAREHFGSDRIIKVAPPPAGSIDPDVFKARLRQATGFEDEDPLALLPDGALVLFDDLHQWWERSEGGLAVVDAIFDAMERHGGRCFFVLAGDSHALRFIQRVREVRTGLLGMIECGPLTAQEIGEVVTTRHGSTGLRYVLDGQDEDRLSDWRRARLFHRIFDASGGRIGVALLDWVRSIREVNGDRLVLDWPAPASLVALDGLEAVARLLVVQFALHGDLTYERLRRITGLAPAALERELAGLRRLGLLANRGRETVGLDPFVRPHVVQYLADREAL